MLSYPPLRTECQISYQVPEVGLILKIAALCFVAIGVPGLLGFLFLIFALKPLFMKSAEG